MMKGENMLSGTEARHISRKIKGMDVSTLVEEERCGAKYYDSGEAEDLFEILKRHGVNSVRLRLWNNPYSPEKDGHRPYGAGTDDLETVMLLAKRAKQAGMTWLLDFHYSDFWADPGKQYPPKGWENYTAKELIKAVGDYTRETMQTLKAVGLLPDMVQVGNELTNGCCWPLGNRDYGRDNPELATLCKGEYYFNPVLKSILVAGIRAVREVSCDSVIMLHLDNGGNNALYRSWFDGYYNCTGCEPGLEHEDFDVIGLSYYPFWHGNFEALQNNMNDIALRYGKELVIAEVSMGFSMEDYRQYEGREASQLKGMATRSELVEKLDFPMTKEGQSAFMRQLNNVINGVVQGLGRGYYYWEPAWIPVPGCGWATEASLEYIHDKGPCGNEWANQALFDYTGHALPALDE